MTKAFMAKGNSNKGFISSAPGFKKFQEKLLYIVIELTSINGMDLHPLIIPRPHLYDVSKTLGFNIFLVHDVMVLQAE